MIPACCTPARFGLILLGLAATATTASAQTSDPDWLPWLGCWRAEEAPANEALCIVREDTGVRLITLESGAVRGESRIITDGRTRAVRQDGCNGTELAHWSADGRRVFLNSDLKCEGDIGRKASGLFVITGPAEWLSVQAVTIDGKTAARTVRYRAIDPVGVPSSVSRSVGTSRAQAAQARRAALAPIDAQDVDEAVNSIDAVAVQEWLSATGQPFELAGDGSDRSPNTISALDLIGGSVRETRTTREVVHVVEPPVIVHHTTVHTVYRSCWDPFASGHVSLGRGVGLHIDVSNGCSRHYYGRYSPWGYDLYGWREVYSPIVIVRGGPTIIRRPPYYRGGGPIVVRDRDRYGRDNWYDRDHRNDRTDRYDRDRDEPRNRGGQVTRGGYTSGPARERAAPTQRSSSDPRTRTTSAPSERTREGTRTASTPRARTSSARENGGTQAPSRSQDGTTRTAKARN